MAKESSPFSRWLVDRLRSCGERQRTVAQRAGVRPNDLSRWKKGQSLPEMDNLLRLAHFFNEDPEQLFHLAGKGYLVEVYRRCFASGQTSRQLREEDLYPNPHHAELHRRLQALIEQSAQERIERFLQEEEEKSPLRRQFCEIQRLTRAEEAALLLEEFDFQAARSLRRCLLQSPGADAELEWCIQPPREWTRQSLVSEDEERSVKLHLLLKRPSIQGFMCELIDYYLEEWLRNPGVRAGRVEPAPIF